MKKYTKNLVLALSLLVSFVNNSQAMQIFKPEDTMIDYETQLALALLESEQPVINQTNDDALRLALALSMQEQNEDPEMDRATAESLRYREIEREEDFQEKQAITNIIVDAQGINCIENLIKLEAYIPNSVNIESLQLLLLTSPNSFIPGTSFFNEDGINLTKEWLAENMRLN